MAGEFTKPNNITPAVLGQIANPDDYNQNIAGQSKGAIVGIDVNGSFADVDLGDEALITNGALIKNIKLREGYYLKFYNASGVFQRNVNLDIASSTLAGLSYATYQSFFGYSSATAISVTAGLFNFSDGTGQAKNSFSGTKTTGSWAAGTGNGGLDTGAIANNTWYYVYAIYNPSTLATDYLISASSSSPTLPSGYTKSKRLRGFFKTNGSAQIINCNISQDGTWICKTSTASEQILINATSQVGSAGTLSNAFPAVFNETLLQIGLDQTGSDFASFTVWGNLQSTPTSVLPPAIGLAAASTSVPNSLAGIGVANTFNNDGVLRYQNFDASGGVSNITVNLLSIRDLSSNI